MSKTPLDILAEPPKDDDMRPFIRALIQSVCTAAKPSELECAKLLRFWSSLSPADADFLYKEFGRTPYLPVDARKNIVQYLVVFTSWATGQPEFHDMNKRIRAYVAAERKKKRQVT